MVPAPLTSILGRQKELVEAARLLAGTRLLTLTGAGGSGKTRLAMELARRDGREAAWVELAPVSDPALVAQQVLNALELPEPPAGDVLAAAIDALRERTLLLVLDNCEHLVDACANVAEAILRGCPNVTILTTTREALGIPGEQTWLVPPLDERDAVQLFAERARAVLPVFAIEPHNAADVARICRRLDGIPLIVQIAGCNDCHTPLKMGPRGPEPDMSRMLSGHPSQFVLPPAPEQKGPWIWTGSATNTAFAGPWGISYARNLTPDQVSGLGIWNEAMFIKTMRTGRHMGVSRPILPPMPWQNLNAMTDDDLKSVFAYLRSIKPIRNEVPDAVIAQH